MSDVELARRFADHVARRGWFDEGDTVVVAVSGGVDSCVLLHLLRFAPALPSVELVAAHFDHGMRPDSSADASWVRGLAGAWGVSFRWGAAQEPPSDEAGAREARYRFLDRVRSEEGARWLVTAHHADDQAETVLFRALRGSGLRGLAGIPERREPSLLRPLLPFWKEDIVAYAEARGLAARIDPTNRDPSFARNALRHRILPEAESLVAPGARRALVRLAAVARAEDRALSSLVGGALDEVVREAEPGRLVLARDPILAHDPAVRGRILRRAARRLGIGLDRAGTRAAVEFTSRGASGRRLELPDGVVLAREFDRLVLTRESSGGEERALALQEPGKGGGEFSVGGRRMRAEWSRGPAPAGDWVECFSPSSARFPFLLRGWVPGDRIRLSYGSKKLKKLFSEERIPVSRRSRVPVVADGGGSVLWVPGVARSVLAPPSEDEAPLYLGIMDAGNE